MLHRAFRRSCVHALGLFVVLGAALLLAGCGRVITPAELDHLGTHAYDHRSQRQVATASRAALKGLGFELLDTGSDTKIKTAPKVVQVTAVGNAYQASTIEDEVAWTIDLDADGKSTVVHARPRGFRNGQPVDGQMSYAYCERAFTNLFHEIDDNLPTR